MTGLLLVPPVLSFLLLGAHFYRSANDALVVVAGVLAVLACVPRRWAVRVAQLGLAAGAVEWARATWAFAEVRAAMGLPWLRLVLILGGVALFTLLSALVYRSSRLSARLGGGSAA
jgi:hypothetical protein